MADAGFILCSAKVGATNISTLEDSSWNDGVDELVTGAAGQHEGQMVVLLRQLSNGTFTTRLITAVEEYTYGTHSLYFRKVADGGVGGTYISMVGSTNKTMAIPRMLTWQEGGVARLSVDMQFFSTNGSTAPITVGSTAGDLTAETLQWVGVGEGVQSITIDHGIRVTPIPDGLLYPTLCFVLERRPTLRYVTTKDTLLTTANINPGSISTLTVQLARVADGGVRGATRSYSLTGRVSVRSVQGKKPGSVEVGCTGKGSFTIA